MAYFVRTARLNVTKRSTSPDSFAYLAVLEREDEVSYHLKGGRSTRLADPMLPTILSTQLHPRSLTSIHVPCQH